MWLMSRSLTNEDSLILFRQYHIIYSIFCVYFQVGFIYSCAFSCKMVLVTILHIFFCNSLLPGTAPPRSYNRLHQRWGTEASHLSFCDRNLLRLIWCSTFELNVAPFRNMVRPPVALLNNARRKPTKLKLLSRNFSEGKVSCSVRPFYA